MNSTSSYDQKTIDYHWLSAVLVIGLWLLGQTIDWFPKDSPRIMARSMHIAFGLLLAFVVIRRIWWRSTQGIKLPKVPGILGRLAGTVHYILYLLLISVLTIGIAAVWIRGDNIFNLFQIPAFDPTNKALRGKVVELHGLFANYLIILAMTHALAALWHQWILKDNLINRMWPGKADQTNK